MKVILNDKQIKEMKENPEIISQLIKNMEDGKVAINMEYLQEPTVGKDCEWWNPFC